MMNWFVLTLFALLHIIGPPDDGKKTYVTRKPLPLDESLHQRIRNAFGYGQAYNVPEHAGGLLPRLPMAMVVTNEEVPNSLFRHNGFLKTWKSLAVQTKKGLVILDTREKFQKVFAPITDEQEAMSFVAFLTETQPRYDIERDPTYRNYTSRFPSAYAYRIRDGYIVLLHRKDFYGCGPHPYYYLRFHVTKKGQITELESVKMYEDPREDNLCVD